MIDVERVMSQPFVLLSQFNTLRQRLLNAVVDTQNVSVKTREVVLRTLDSQYGPIFARLREQSAALHVDICEKRNVLLIEDETAVLNTFFLEAVKSLTAYRVPKQHLDQLMSAIRSNSPVLRVSGKCAALLLFSYIELDAMNV
jgi:hypothetical protein